MTDLTTRIQAWLWGRPVHSEATQHAEQIARMFDDLGLVVIDPSDGEQTAALTKALMAGGIATAIDVHAVVKRALRSLITPPKPDEPQGLGAVVEDAHGKRWTRVGGNEECPWFTGIPRRTPAHVPDETVAKFSHYSDIATVRVLSEGVAS